MRFERRSPCQPWLLPLILASTSLNADLASAQQPLPAPENPVREAVGLLMDNQDRCLKLAYSKLDILEMQDTDAERSREAARGFEGENRIRIMVARNAGNLTHDLASSSLSGATPAEQSAVTGMVSAQERLCDWATGNLRQDSSHGASDYIREMNAEFEQALRSLPLNLQLSSSERLVIVRKYRNRLYSSGGASSNEAIERAMAADRDALAGPRISGEEYQRKKKAYEDWTAEQKRQEAEKIRLLAQRRAEQQKRREQPRDMPRLKLNKPDKGVPTAAAAGNAPPDAMVKWHSEYTIKITPVKQALSKFLASQSRSRTLIMNQACQDLALATRKILEDPTALKAPDAGVSGTLRAAFTSFKQASDACTSDRLKATREYVAAGERALGQAVQALQPYGLGL